MRSNRPANLLLLVLVLILIPSVALGGDPEPVPEVTHREAPDDPPAAAARDQQARSTSATAVRNAHISVQVNVDGAGNNIIGDAANEPTIAIDPTNPQNIVIGWRQFDTIASNFRQAGYAYSHDGGASWTFPGVLDPGQFRSDPVLSADADGDFFYYSLSSTTTTEMFISSDAGLSWTGPISNPGGDKNWMTIDDTGGLGLNHIYLIWNSQFTCCDPGTDFSRSVDSGLTYEGPQALPQKPKWGTVAVGPDGEVYVVGTRISTLSFPDIHLIQKSTNANDPGQIPSFDLVTGLDLGGGTFAGGTPNPGGLLGQVWVAVDRSTQSSRGNVYVVASVDPVGIDPMDVHFLRSIDGGVTWTPPLRINDSPAVNGAWDWFATMSVAPGGRIDVVWNDTRNDLSGTTSELHYAYSTNAGSTWSAGLAITPAWNSLVGHPNQSKIGDYYHMVSDDLVGNLAYSATFNGEQDVWFVKVGDCNSTGAHDSVDIADGTSEDCNANGIPDECEDDVSCGTCNDDGACQPGEDCTTCSGDCITGITGCGNGVCEPSLGEDCLSCEADCDGKQKGNPRNQFCCGDGAGTNPVGCEDLRCASCSVTPADPSCCGDGTCEGIENTINCAVDCGTIGDCGNGVCDPGENCESCDTDCEGRLNGKPANRFCCGNGILEGAEGDGTVCDGNP